jgi:hypothetical protein
MDIEELLEDIDRVQDIVVSEEHDDCNEEECTGCDRCNNCNGC